MIAKYERIVSQPLKYEAVGVDREIHRGVYLPFTCCSETQGLRTHPFRTASSWGAAWEPLLEMAIATLRASVQAWGDLEIALLLTGWSHSGGRRADFGGAGARPIKAAQGWTSLHKEQKIFRETL